MTKLRKRTVNLYIDGGMIGPKNPSTIGVFWSVGRERTDGGMDMWTSRAESFTHFTNNEAEYLALIDALEKVQEYYPQGCHVIIHCDSQLIVNQFDRTWKCEQDRLQRMLGIAHKKANRLMMADFDIDLLWVRRRENVKRLGH